MNKEIIRLRLSAQNALIGRITSKIRGVYIKIYQHKIDLCIVIDGEDEYLNDVIYEIGTEIISDFDDGYDINEELIRIDYPNGLIFKDYICVYRRYEK